MSIPRRLAVTAAPQKILPSLIIKAKFWTATPTLTPGREFSQIYATFIAVLVLHIFLMEVTIPSCGYY